ncbi:hypothetical protein O6H91_12G088900 [Diphasiastrum complanatum]|uniref:Uncharacterized protein n=2 Tax=Diphasiastrum complanatum TaxID=34168 RepID=A0ACC2C4H5_DIPCM|nr:hypothetical protein O6H91_12G088300 [Diphasiastrum complanatum]KAJ7536933.1 hypothetical protein O6H91_12G088900 [Diphasiastrum complanatum]
MRNIDRSVFVCSRCIFQFLYTLVPAAVTSSHGKCGIREKYGTPEENYDDFTAALPENDCRYAVFDFDFVTDKYCQKSKIFFIAWSPDTVRVKAKMIYANSKDRFRRELDGVHYEL